MKKIILSNPEAEVIDFLVRGQRHTESAVVVEISADGVMCDDRDADIIEDRLGGQVIVTAVTAKEAGKAAEKALGNAGGEVPEPSDTVKKLAEENDIDLATVTGTGAKDAILKKDVEEAIKVKAEAAE